MLKVYHAVNTARKPPKTRHKAFERSDEQRAVRKQRTRLTATAQHWARVYSLAPAFPSKGDGLPIF